MSDERDELDTWLPGLDYPEAVHDRERELEAAIRDALDELKFPCAECKPFVERLRAVIEGRA